MSTSNTAHEMPPEPEQDVNSEDFGFYISKFFVGAILENVSPRFDPVKVADPPRFSFSMQDQVLGSIGKLTPVLAPELNSRMAELTAVGTDENGPTGILAEVAARIGLPSEAFPTMLILRIRHEQDGSTRILMPAINSEGRLVDETLWSFAARSSLQTSAAMTTDIHEPSQIELSPSTERHVLDALKRWIKSFRK